MRVAEHASPYAVAEGRVLMHGVPWSTYVVLRDTVEGAVRMTYLDGELELLSTSPAHETTKKMVARLIELFCLERDIPLFGYGSTTYRSEEAKRGLEPDECYRRGGPGPRPHVAIEVIVSSGLLDKLEVYRGLGIGEVWLLEDGHITVHVLTGDRYEVAPSSPTFPEVDLERLGHFARQEDQHRALLDYRAELR